LGAGGDRRVDHRHWAVSTGGWVGDRVLSGPRCEATEAMTHWLRRVTADHFWSLIRAGVNQSTPSPELKQAVNDVLSDLEDDLRDQTKEGKVST